MEVTMQTYKSHDYEYGDLVVLLTGRYNKIEKGEIGIIKNTYSSIANIQFANGAGAFGYHEFAPLEALCNSK